MPIPKLSVTIPNYNHGRFLPRCLDAILAQSEYIHEIIIIDDGSTDNSVEIIQKYVDANPIIKFYRHTENKGLFYTSARLNALATGEYIAGCAADDYILNGLYKNIVEMASRYPEAGIIFGKMRVVSPEGEIIRVEEIPWLDKPVYLSPNDFLEQYLRRISPMHSLGAATVYKRSAFVHLGKLRVELGAYSDTFSARAIGLKYGACYLPVECTAWTVNPGSISDADNSSPWKLLDIMERVARLMRSDEFRELFPETYVKWWSRKYRQIVIYRHLAAWKNQILEKHNFKHRSGIDALPLMALAFLLNPMDFFRMGNEILKLRFHKGDTSCYDSK